MCFGPCFARITVFVLICKSLADEEMCFLIMHVRCCACLFQAVRSHGRERETDHFGEDPMNEISDSGSGSNRKGVNADAVTGTFDLREAARAVEHIVGFRKKNSSGEIWCSRRFRYTFATTVPDIVCRIVNFEASFFQWCWTQKNKSRSTSAPSLTKQQRIGYARR